MFRLFSACLIAVCFSAALPLHADEAGKLLDKLQGKWDIAEIKINGEASDALKKAKFVVSGDLLSVNIPKEDGGDDKLTFRIKPDGSKSPAWLDLTTQGGSDDGKVVPAIYVLSDAEWKICAAFGGGDLKRPTEFASEKDSSQVLVRLTRAKP